MKTHDLRKSCTGSDAHRLWMERVARPVAAVRAASASVGNAVRAHTLARKAAASPASHFQSAKTPTRLHSTQWQAM